MVHDKDGSLTVLQEILDELRKLRVGVGEVRDQVNALRGAVTADTMRAVINYTAEHQMSFESTLAELAASRKSFARFGDGELRLLVDPGYHLGFQKNSSGLRRDLREILREGSSEDLLIGWPRPFRTLHNTNVWTIVWKDLMEIVPDGAKFGNSHVSRPVFFKEVGWSGVSMWRKIWEQAAVTIVAGEGSRFEMLPELFDNLKSYDFIFSKPRNAYDDIERVMSVVRQRSTSDLYLVALGPAGTILSHRLACAGYRALDIGHLSGSFLNVFEGHVGPESKPVSKLA